MILKIFFNNKKSLIKNKSMSYPFCRQETTWDCSMACIYMIAKFFHNIKFSYQKMLNKHHYFDDLNLLQMQKIGDQYGFSLMPYYVSWNDFKKTKKIFPLILQIKEGGKMHFVVVYKKRWNKLLIADPNENQIKWVEIEKIAKIFNQIVLLVKKTIYLNDLKETKINHHFFYQNLLFGFFGVLLISLGITFLTIGLQIIFKIIIDEIFIKKLENYLQALLFGWSALLIQKIIWKFTFHKIINIISLKHKERWNHKFFNRIQELKWIDYQKYGIEKIIFYYQKFNEMLDFYFPNFLYIINDIIIIFISLIILFFYYQLSVFLLIIIVFIFVFINFLIFPWYSKNIEKTIAKEKKFQQQFINYLKNYLDIQNRNLNFIKGKKFFYTFEKIKTLHQKNIKWKRIYFVIYEIFFGGINFLFIFLLAQKIKTISPGIFIFIFTITNNILQKSWSLINNFFYWKKIKITSKKIIYFLIKKTSKEKFFLKKEINEIKFINVNYSFDAHFFLWEKNINLKIEKNLLLLGPSGSGKTTFLNILAKNLEKYHGKIIINRQQLSTNSYWNWKKEVYYLNAKSNVFDGTVLENIFNIQKNKLFLKKWKKYQIEKILKDFNLTSLSYISNKTISNGQKQIVNFINLWFCEEKIILLDECLNSIPKKNKEILISKLLNDLQKKIVIYVSHDLKLKKYFQNIYQFSKNEL